MFSPVTVHTPLPGVRIVEPSSSVYDPVPITAPIVGTPTVLPSPSCLKPAGNISASDAERSFCITTIGPKKFCGRGCWKLAAGQDAQQLLVDAAAAVEALIDHERLPGAVGREIELEAAQRRRVHGAD